MTKSEYYKRYYEINRERIIANVTRYRLANPEVVAKRSAEYHANNKEHISKRARAYREKHRPTLEAKRKFRKYGITEEHYQRLFNEQSGLCAICRTRPAESVDHSHATKEIRGLLCDQCNCGLGFFMDNPDLMTSAIEYIQKWATPFRKDIDA